MLLSRIIGLYKVCSMSISGLADMTNELAKAISVSV
jgi:hypothetical protein